MAPRTGLGDRPAATGDGGVIALALLCGGTAASALLAGVPARRRVPARNGHGRATRVRPDASSPACAAVPDALVLDVVAEVLASGAPVARSVRSVGEALLAVHDPRGLDLLRFAPGVDTTRATDRGAPPRSRAPGRRRRRPAGADPPARLDDVLARVSRLALLTGAGPADLVRAAAQEQRRLAAARSVQAARRLAVLVLLPTGLCLLPAFLLVTVVPLALSLLAG